ncbi:MAG TPA: hypothetical protein VMU54_11155 [Planctomycetota bacterium]|nr:hypothetical protein [Planctomycetota bacterium]
MRFRGKRPRTGRFTRPSSPSPGNPPLDDPILHTPSPNDGLLDAEPFRAQKSGPSQNSTAGLTEMDAGDESQDETSGALTIIPEPPDRVEFACPCGRVLVATREHYDRRSRCAACRTVLLLNLVYKRDLRSFEIEPLRVDLDPGP